MKKIIFLATVLAVVLFSAFFSNKAMAAAEYFASGLNTAQPTIELNEDAMSQAGFSGDYAHSSKNFKLMLVDLDTTISLYFLNSEDINNINSIVNDRKTIRVLHTKIIDSASLDEYDTIFHNSRLVRIIKSGDGYTVQNRSGVSDNTIKSFRVANYKNLLGAIQVRSTPVPDGQHYPFNSIITAALKNNSSFFLF